MRTYHVHRLDVTEETMQERLQRFIASLRGEIVSVVPHVRRYVMLYGAKTDYLLIVERRDE